jgi:hypothetical protein
MHNEHPSYYSKYIDLVEDGNIVEILENQKSEMSKLLNSLGEEAANFSYAADKWSIKEVVGHIIDVEKVFTYRAFRFARNDKTPLAEFDQDNYIKYANFNARTMIDIAEEFRAVREMSIIQFGSFNDEIMTCTGTASGSNFSVRSISYIIAGHEIHHRQVINTKYLSL